MLPMKSMLDAYANDFGLDRQALAEALHEDLEQAPAFLSVDKEFCLDVIAISTASNGTASVRQAVDAVALRWRNAGRAIPDTGPSGIAACLERYREEAAKNARVLDGSDILDEFARTCSGEFLERFGIRFQDAPEPARYAIVSAVCDDLERTSPCRASKSPGTTSADP